jgi:hypothetical protein
MLGEDQKGFPIRVKNLACCLLIILSENNLTSRSEVKEICVYESGLPVDEELKNKFYDNLISGNIYAIIFESGFSAQTSSRYSLKKCPWMP